MSWKKLMKVNGNESTSVFLSIFKVKVNEGERKEVKREGEKNIQEEREKSCFTLMRVTIMNIINNWC